MKATALFAFAAVVVTAAPASVQISGDLARWRKVTLTVDGPATAEDAATNPFRSYRMDVRFTHAAAKKSYTVPGYFAADGNAAETSAAAGNKWRAHFLPDEAGEWQAEVSFRSGGEGGGPTVEPNGARASFRVRNSKDRGLLRYVGKHHLQFAGSGEYFLKGGADSPENFLAYADFDQTHDADADSGSYKKVGPFLHRYEPHVKDWRAGDPSWKAGKGKGIIGALNYLEAKGVNSVYFLTYNLDGGDGRDTWMWTGPDVRDRYDVSKLAQWEIVFEHMTRLGIMLHVVTQETENDRALGGSAGLNEIRRLYYRELVARFAHHPALVWNLGEENNTPDADRKAIAAYIRSIDAYKHPITVHTHNNKAPDFYNGILGDANFEASSIQGDMRNYNREAIELRRRSAAAGRPWAIFGDEQAAASTGVLPDAADPEHDKPRKQALWGNLMGGGSGVEWYFGYEHPHMDINLEDFRSRDRMWEQTKHALEFFRRHLPFANMEPANDRADGPLVLAKGDEVVAAYLPEGGEARLRLGAGAYRVQWFNPRSGGALVRGNRVEGGGAVSIGAAPAGGDWVAVVTRER